MPSCQKRTAKPVREMMLACALWNDVVEEVKRCLGEATRTEARPEEDLADHAGWVVIAAGVVRRTLRD